MEQTSLFGAPTADANSPAGERRERLAVADGDLWLIHDWLTPAAAGQLWRLLEQTLAWHQDRIHLHGRQVLIPRLNAWYGDPGLDYRYSGLHLRPHPWTPALADLRRQVEVTLRSLGITSSINSCLANLYRDGNDSVAWHSDDEPELGPNPVIASVSLGAERRFLLKHKHSGERLALDLPAGSLLVMAGALQHHWRHQLPKTRRPVDSRVNLTFRRIVSPRRSSRSE